MEQRTALYRHYDSAGRLLYIGISLNAISRLADHKRAAHWSSFVANMRVQYFPTRREALDAERAAIVKERPIHNIAHNRRNEDRAPERKPPKKIDYSAIRDRDIPKLPPRGHKSKPPIYKPPAPNEEDEWLNLWETKDLCGMSDPSKLTSYRAQRVNYINGITPRGGHQFWLKSDVQSAMLERFNRMPKRATA